MCGRYTLAAPDPAQVRARFPIDEVVEVRRRYNVAPGDDVLAVTTDREGTPRGELLRWGLVPAWAKQPATGLRMINARVETVADRPAFRRAFERYRCLIVADGFYEWRRLAAGPKQAFHITRTDGAPFAFAGLWSIWHGDDGQRLRTCTILTTAAGPAIAPLHDRMPVILAPDAEAAWLDASPSAERLRELLVGLGPREVALRPVGPAVNDARYDGPECLAPLLEERQTALF
ncbi:MAG: SOS response-associated peptidase [Solirubrobacterales bacterium]|nr:SOS response-associated peptidase [Solirubrobacterales bacterium]